MFSLKIPEERFEILDEFLSIHGAFMDGNSDLTTKNFKLDKIVSPLVCSCFANPETPLYI